MSWHEFAERFKRCFCKLTVSEYGGDEVRRWIVFLPRPHGCVSVKTIEDAREVSAKYGCEICL
jgi:hypothetical protein